MWIGLIGMSLILAAYFLKSVEKISNIRWHALNGAGAALLVGYAGLNSVWPFFILNFVWCLVALKGIYDYFKQNGYNEHVDLSETQANKGG